MTGGPSPCSVDRAAVVSPAVNTLPKLTPPQKSHSGRGRSRATSPGLTANKARLVDVAGTHEHGPADRLRVVVVVDGDGTHETVYGRRRLCRGDVLLLRPGAWQAFEGKPTLRLIVLELDADGESMLATPALRRLSLTARVCDGAAALWMSGPGIAACLEALEEGEPEWLGRLADGVAADLNAALPEAESPHPAVVAALRALEASPTRAWTMPDLAAAAGIVPAYLSRLFRRQVGRPPMAYLNRRRAEAAAALLLRGDEPVGDVATAVGWPPGNTFSRCFRRHFGCSAQAFRAAHAA